MIDNLLNTKATEKIKDLSRFYDEIYYKKYNRLEIMNNPNSSKAKSVFLFILDYLEVPFDKKKKLLDVACGGGGLLHFADHRVLTYGVDISQLSLQYAARISPGSVLKKCQAEKLPFTKEEFDFITCLGSLEHFLDPLKALKEIKRVLKPKGKCLIMVPNIFFIFGVFKVGFFGGSPTHHQKVERFNTLDGWQSLIESGGLKVIKRRGYNPTFFLKKSDWLKPLRLFGKAGWLLFRNLLPQGLSYDLLYVTERESDD
ncbi:class I SAM-dependent methyltransferase [Patescibacteria group bacterium]|nr:class I SAM-dependent methyltransferase [Patescibacteria group bacterium]MBU1931399.1 class I SAM-dependent methyltransferase [Patescibacteria group bacterium]